MAGRGQTTQLTLSGPLRLPSIERRGDALQSTKPRKGAPPNGLGTGPDIGGWALEVTRTLNFIWPPLIDCPNVTNLWRVVGTRVGRGAQGF
jgi:hypothetical protein